MLVDYGPELGNAKYLLSFFNRDARPGSNTPEIIRSAALNAKGGAWDCRCWFVLIKGVGNPGVALEICHNYDTEFSVMKGIVSNSLAYNRGL